MKYTYVYAQMKTITISLYKLSISSKNVKGQNTKLTTGKACQPFNAAPNLQNFVI